MSEPTPSPDPTPHRPDGWDLVCAGILGAEFGRKKSNALANAIAQLSAEEAALVPRRWRFHAWWSSLRPFPRFAFVTACVLVIGLADWVVWRVDSEGRPPSTGAVCFVSGQLHAVWAGRSASPKTGDALLAGAWRLGSGVVELTFNSKARVAIEGPAEIKLTGPNSMELLSGKLSAEVPRQAHGFSVKFPGATVVDLGTRFGVNAGVARSKVDVFEGKVLLVSDAVAVAHQLLTQGMAMAVDPRGAATMSVYSAAAYPQLSTMLVIHPVNCGFDGPGKTETGGVPVAAGYWSGWGYDLVRARQGVAPLQGRGMLRFLSPSSRAAKSADSEVWQLIDLRTNHTLIAGGGVEVRSSVFFNRVRGNSYTGKKFVLAMAAFHGTPENVEDLWARRHELALAVAEKEIVTDDNPATWEKVELSAALPADADFLIVEMRAIAPDAIVAGTPPFNGHFADLIDCSLYGELGASASHQ
jgi:hypothetical protein